MTQEQSQDTVSVGTSVKLAGFDPDEEETIQIVEDAAAQPTEMNIGQSAPLAQVLLGKRVGDQVAYKTPIGELKLEVLSIRPL